MAERLPADVWAQILAAAGEEIFALSVSSQQMRRVLHRDALDAAWIQVIRRVSERSVARADVAVDLAAGVAVDLGARFALREKLRGFFAARAGRADRVWEWFDANAPRVAARGVRNVAVARDGTLAVLTKQRLELRRGGAVVGTLPNDYREGTASGLYDVQAAGSRFLVTMPHQSMLMVSSADASVIENVPAVYFPIGGDWVRVRTRSTQGHDELPLLNLETGATVTAADAGLASFLAVADDETLVLTEFDAPGTLREHDVRTGAFRGAMATPFSELVQTFVRGRVLYNMKHSPDRQIRLQAVNLDTGVVQPELAVWQRTARFSDDRTLVNFGRDIDVYTDGALSHVCIAEYHVNNLVYAHGRRLWYLLDPEGTYWASWTGVLYEVDLGQPAFASPERM